MSYTELYAIGLDGEARGVEEYRNSHGGASMVWSALCRRYGKSMYPDASLMKDHSTEWLHDDGVWDKFNALPLRWWECNVLHFTYDRTIVKAEDLELMAQSLERFEDAHGTPGYVCHLPAMAAAMRGLSKEGETIGACLYATSCGDNLWSIHDEAAGGSRPYNINIDTRHRFIECRSAASDGPTPPR